MDEPVETKRQAPIDPRLLEILVCPLTKGPLEYDREASELISRNGGAGISGARRHSDHAARGGAQAGGVMASLPTEIRLNKAERVLHVAFDDGGQFALPAEYLRVESPSAEVQGHSPDQKQIVPGKRRVAIIAVEPVGNYAVRLVFDDRHDTGIYSWDYLRELDAITTTAMGCLPGGVGSARDEQRSRSPKPPSPCGRALAGAAVGVA